MTVRAGARPGRAEAGDAGLAAAEGKGFAVACDAARIKGYLDGMGVGFVREVLTLGEVDSTNSYLKRLAEGGGAAGALLVAGSQTAGRGRLGRGWVSKASKGIYMSMSLAADGPPECLRLAGMAAAVAVGAVLCEV
ncbi:MAG: hypothetical protein FWE70_01455, partial [Oscillospiraceae bacterium]|nr:hypothetical protein [Oscillospiraceae bacterium]